MNQPTIIIDTNKILAAILRPGKVRRNLFKYPSPILTPAEAWKEAEKHIEKLAEKKKIPLSRLRSLLEEIKSEVITTETAREPFTRKAEEIASRFDPGDAPFIALALQHNAPIWTNDYKLIKHSHKTRKYTAIDTEGVEMLLNGEPLEKVKERMREKY